MMADSIRRSDSALRAFWTSPFRASAQMSRFSEVRAPTGCWLGPSSSARAFMAAKDLARVSTPGPVMSGLRSLFEVVDAEPLAVGVHDGQGEKVAFAGDGDVVVSLRVELLGGIGRFDGVTAGIEEVSIRRHGERELLGHLGLERLA